MITSGFSLAFNGKNLLENSKEMLWQRNIYQVTTSTDGHGTMTASPMSGFPGTNVTLSNTPNANYSFSGYSITGATLTGNQFTLNNDVTARAGFSAEPHYTAKRVNGYLMSVNASAWADDDYRRVYVYENSHPDYHTIIPFNSTAATKNFYVMPTNAVYTTFTGNSALFDGFKVQAMGGYNRLSGKYLNTTALINRIDVAAEPWVYLNNTATGSAGVLFYMSINNGTPELPFLSGTIDVNPGQTVYRTSDSWSFRFDNPIIVNSGSRINLKITPNITNGSISANLKNIQVYWAGTISGLEK